MKYRSSQLLLVDCSSRDLCVCVCVCVCVGGLYSSRQGTTLRLENPSMTLSSNIQAMTWHVKSFLLCVNTTTTTTTTTVT